MAPTNICTFEWDDNKDANSQHRQKLTIPPCFWSGLKTKNRRTQAGAALTSPINGRGQSRSKKCFSQWFGRVSCPDDWQRRVRLEGYETLINATLREAEGG